MKKKEWEELLRKRKGSPKNEALEQSEEATPQTEDAQETLSNLQGATQRKLEAEAKELAGDIQSGEDQPQPPEGEIPQTQAEAEAREKAVDAGKYYLPGLTEEESARLLAQEQGVNTKGLEQARLLREIRTEGKWAKILDDQGKRKYATYEDYCDDRLPFTKNRVTQITKWLACMERLADMRNRGLDVPEYIASSAVEALPDYALKQISGLDLETVDPTEAVEAGLLLVLEEAQALGSLSRDTFRSICTKRRVYQENKDSFKAQSYEAYLADLKTLEAFNIEKWEDGVTTTVDFRDGRVWQKVEGQPGLFEENLVTQCKEDLAFPTCEPTTHRGVFSDNASWRFQLSGATTHRGDWWRNRLTFP